MARTRSDNLPAYTQMHKGSIRFIREIPADLITVVGKRNFTKTLYTTCAKEAAKRIHTAMVEYDNLIARYRNVPLFRGRPGTNQAAIIAHYHSVDAVTETSIPVNALDAPTVSFAELVELWGDTSIPSKSLKARHDANAAWNRLTGIVGQRNPSTVSKADIVALRDSLVRSGSVKGGTIRNIIKNLAIVFQYALESDRLPANPARGVPLNFEDDSTPTADYTRDETTLILTLARQETDPVTRWCSLLAYFTSCRIGDIVGSAASAIQVIDGTHCLVLTNATRMPGERFKTGSRSERAIPLHPQIIAEGFLAYVSTLPEGSALFPTLRVSRDGKRSERATDKMSDFIQKTCGITMERNGEVVKPDHSFRHTFSTEARLAGIPEDVHHYIEGRSNPGKRVGRGYGAYAISLLAEAIGKLHNPLA
jgi:integrase